MSRRSALMTKTPNSCLPGMVLPSHVDQIMFQVKDVALHAVIDGKGGQVPFDHGKVGHGLPKAGYRDLIAIIIIILIFIIFLILLFIFLLFITI